MTLLRRFREWWWARQRAADLATLWPVCKEQAQDIHRAKAAFAYHAFLDPAWIEFYGHDKLIEVIDALD